MALLRPAPGTYSCSRSTRYGREGRLVVDGVMATPRLGLRSRTGNFARHFLEMCVAMCVGGGILYALAFYAGPAVLGYADPRQQFPELSLVAVALIFILPMALWMRFRGMEWRPILEMAGAGMGVAILLIGLAWLAILSQAGLREFAGPAFCGPACVAMVGAMLFRLDLYTGHTGHHMAHAQSVA
jgi:hypothetical protein